MSDFLDRMESVYHDRDVLREVLIQYHEIQSKSESEGSLSNDLSSVLLDVKRALRSLESIQRQCIMMNLVLGYTEWEVAEQFPDLSQQKVNYRIRKGLDSMMRYLSDIA